MQFVQQHAIKLRVAGGLRPGNLLAAAEWALHAEQVDFAGIALHAGLDTHAHPRNLGLHPYGDVLREALALPRRAA